MNIVTVVCLSGAVILILVTIYVFFLGDRIDRWLRSR